MKPDTVQRFRFSSDEAIAALLPNALASEYRELRIEGDELLIEFVNPKGSEVEETDRHDVPANQETGPLEQIVLDLLEIPAFVKWGKCETKEEAKAKLLGRFGVKELSELDMTATKHAKADVQDISARFNAWMEGN